MQKRGEDKKIPVPGRFMLTQGEHVYGFCGAGLIAERIEIVFLFATRV